MAPVNPLGRKLTASYLKTFLVILNKAGLTEHQSIKFFLENQDDYVALSAFAKQIKDGVNNFDAGNKVGGPLAGAIVAVVGVIMNVVDTVLQTMEIEEKIKLLRFLFVKICSFVGPPPIWMLHYANKHKIRIKDPYQWYYYIWPHILRIAIQFEKDFPKEIEKAEMLDATGFAAISRKESYYGFIPSWEQFKPDSKMGPNYSYGFDFALLFAEMIAPSVENSKMGDLYRLGLSTHDFTGKFDLADWQSIFAKAGIPADKAFYIFQVGHDPFSWIDGATIVSRTAYYGRLTLTTGGRSWLLC